MAEVADDAAEVADDAAEAGPFVPTPVPVSGELSIRRIHGAILNHPEAADFGAAFSVVLTGTEQPVDLLPYDVNRARAYITCTGTGPVYIGYKDPSGVQALRNGLNVSGQIPAFVLAAGQSLPIAHKQQVWLAPDGTHTATVSVAVERWES